MDLTLAELKARLNCMEVTYLVELLELDSDDITDRFSDVIEMNFGRLASELEEGFDVRLLEAEEEGKE